MIKLIALDVDGTLLPQGQKNIDEGILGRIGCLLDKNVKVVIASGRSYANLCVLFGNVSKKLIFVCHDGAITVENGKRLGHKSISRDTVLRFMNYYSCFGGVMAFYGENVCYATGKSSVLDAENVSIVKGVHEIKEQIYKIALYSDNNPIHEMLPKPNDVRISSFAEDCLEYVPLIADKGASLSDIQSKYFMTMYDTAALGNEVNDIKMLKNSKFSGVMRSAPESVKACADIIVDDACEFIDNIIAEKI